MWCEIVAQMWAAHVPGTTIELMLSDGETLTPERFAASASRGPAGLFAAKNANGSYTLTAVAWNTVSRVVVRNLKSLPDWLA